MPGAPGSQDFQRHLLEALAEGVCGLDREGYFTFINPAGVRLLGYADEQELLGRHAHATIHYARPDGSPYPYEECPTCQAMRCGEPLEAWEDCLRRRDGTCFPALIYASPLHDEHGAVSGAVVSFQDITERKAAEHALRESERRFRQMAEGIGEVFWLSTRDEVLYINPAYERIWGRSVEALYARPDDFLEAIHPEDRDRVQQGLRQAQAHRAPLDEAYRIVHPDGEVRWIHSQSHPLSDAGEQGEARRAGTARDVTDYKALQHRLEEALSAKTDFLNAVSHDLRTPLNALMGFTELLGGSSLDAEQRHHLRLCRTAGERLLGLVDTLLELSRLQAGKLALHPEPLELRPFLDEQLEMLHSQAAEKGLRLDWEVDPTLPRHVDTDPNRFAQVLLNLVGNAVQYTEQGAVQVSLAPDGAGRARAAVRDTGPGVPAQAQERIFEAFDRAGRSDRQQGCGLGLAIARELVALLGGEIGLESEPGAGSTFTFTLDLPAASGAAAPPDEPGALAAPQGREAVGAGLQVVAAEDEPTNALLVQTLLEWAECSALAVVADGRAALAAWRRLGPDLVLLDVQMPEMDGYETIQAIRAEEAEAGAAPVPIAVLTAHALEEVEAACYEAGCDAYLTKPVRWQAVHDLLAWVQQHR